MTNEEPVAVGELVGEQGETRKKETADLPILAEQPGLPVVGNPMDLDPAQFAYALERRRQNRKTLLDWLRAALVDGIDYGRIHVKKKTDCEHARKNKSNPAGCPDDSHYSKPILFKPGAEKICGMLGLKPSYPMMTEYERAVIDGRKISHVILKCHLLNAKDEIVAEGVGARTLEKDYHDLNKSLKMAEKSGHIDATLRVGGLSEIFTQDGDAIPQDGDDEVMTEEHNLVLFNIIKNAGLFDDDERVHRQLKNLARSLGHESIVGMPLHLFDTCKAQLEAGIARTKKKDPAK